MGIYVDVVFFIAIMIVLGVIGNRVDGIATTLKEIKKKLP